MQIKFQLPTREQLPTLDSASAKFHNALDSASAKFHSAKNAITEKFQSNNLLNGESVLEFARENRVELGAAGAAILASGLAIYSIPSQELIDDKDIIKSENITQIVNDTAKQTASFDVTDFSSLTASGPITVVASIILVLAAKCLCCPRVCKKAPQETEAAKHNRLALAAEEQRIKNVNIQVSNICNSTQTRTFAAFTEQLADVNVLGATKDSRKVQRDLLLNITDADLENLQLYPALKAITNSINEAITQPIDNAEIENALVEILFKDVTESAGKTTNKQLASNIVARINAIEQQKAADVSTDEKELSNETTKTTKTTSSARRKSSEGTPQGSPKVSPTNTLNFGTSTTSFGNSIATSSSSSSSSSSSTIAPSLTNPVQVSNEQGQPLLTDNGENKS